MSNCDLMIHKIKYYISNNKLKELGWKITTNLHNGLESLIQN